MKWWINVVLVIMVMVLVLPTIIVRSCSVPVKVGKESVPGTDELKLEIEHQQNEPVITMYDHLAKKMVKMPLEEYVAGSVAAEMPASFEMEALKAQAVASRTLAVYKLKAFGGKGCALHPGADICSSFAHCQAWISEEQQRKNWGSAYVENHNKIVQAVQATRDEIITYRGKPIEVFFYSTSNGKTEDVAEVFSNSLPYYGVVDSTGEEDAPRYHGSVSLTNQRFIEVFKSKYSSAHLSSSQLSSQIKILSYTESGRVKELSVGGVRVKGTDFRYLYGLNSADFRFSFAKGKVVISTTGFGHGVGMSQVGADRMAQKGYDYNHILLHYYQGVAVEKNQSRAQFLDVQ